MGAVWMWAQHDLRRKWRSTVLLALLVGLVSAVVLTGIAGARRTASSYDRFVTESRVSDVFVFAGEITAQQLRDFADVPYITAIAAAQTLQVQYLDGEFPNAAAPVDDSLGTLLERPRILEGRAPNPRSPNEIAIGEALAQLRGLRVGETLELRSFSPSQIDAQRSGEATSIPRPAGPDLRLHIVGISRSPSDLSIEGSRGGILLFTPAFGARYDAHIGSYAGDVLAARLRHGSDDVTRITGRAQQFFGSAWSFSVEPAEGGTAGVQESIDVLAVGALIFAAVAAIAGLTATILVLRRRIDTATADHEMLRALGLTRTQRALAGGLSAVPIAILGGLVGVVGAFLASPLLPMGLARRAEPDPGLHFDPMVLGVGFVVIVGVLLAVVGVLGWRSAAVGRARDLAPKRTTVTARASAALGVGPTMSIGVGMALDRRASRSGVAVRAALVATIAAVLGVTGVAVFGTSLQRLEASPARYGFNWDARVIDNRLESAVPDRPCTVRRSRLTRVPGLVDVASVCTIIVRLGGRPVVAYGIRSLRGSIEPTIVDGRAPRDRHEVALGAATLSALDRSIGGRVHGVGPDGPLSYRIVGVTAAPRFDDPFASPVPVDDVAFFTAVGLDALDDPTDADASQELLVGVASGANREVVLQRVERLRGVDSYGDTPGVSRALVPLEVERLTQIDALPIVLAAFLAVLGIVTVGFVLASSVRRRGRELAVLKTLGFSRRQVSTTIAWQATTTAVVGTLVGLPLGVVVGRGIWRSVASDLGVVATPEVPIIPLIVVAITAVALANLIAALPAWSAARTRPAVILRSE